MAPNLAFMKLREAALGFMTLNGVSLAVQMEVLADVVAGRMPWGYGSWKVGWNLEWLGSMVMGSMGEMFYLLITGIYIRG